MDTQPELVRVEEWACYPWLAHGFSTRAVGTSTAYGGHSLNLGWTREDPESAVAENRRLLVESVSTGARWRLSTLQQVHGVGIRVVEPLEETQSPSGRALYEGDGSITSSPGVLLGVLTADCVPVIVADVRQRVVAALHAGWRGTAAGMAAVGVERLRLAFGCKVEDLVAAVGPSIGPCCYAVGEEVRTAFHAGFDYGTQLFAEDRLDLWEANRRQLVAAGVAAERVSVVGQCTACARTEEGQRRYFSHRAERGVTGRLMSVVGVLDSR